MSTFSSPLCCRIYRHSTPMKNCLACGSGSHPPRGSDRHWKSPIETRERKLFERSVKENVFTPAPKGSKHNHSKTIAAAGSDETPLLGAGFRGHFVPHSHKVSPGNSTCLLESPKGSCGLSDLHSQPAPRRRCGEGGNAKRGRGLSKQAAAPWRYGENLSVSPVAMRKPWLAAVVGAA